MEYFFFLLILWVFGGYFGGIILIDFVFPLLWLSAQYLLQCLIVTFLVIVQIALKITGLFIRTLIPLSRSAAEHKTDDQNSYEDQGECKKDESFLDSQVEKACALLGLATSHTREELNRAYKRAIRNVHPDNGGTHHDAVRINVARDLLLTVNGWV